MRSDPPRPLELRAINRGSSMRLFLEGAEVWCGLKFLGIVSADWLATQVQERLAYIATTEWLKADLSADPTRHLGPPLVPTRALAAPSYSPVTRADKAKRRVQRRLSKGRRRPP